MSGGGGGEGEGEGEGLVVLRTLLFLFFFKKEREAREARETGKRQKSICVYMYLCIMCTWRFDLSLDTNGNPISRIYAKRLL